MIQQGGAAESSGEERRHFLSRADNIALARQFVAATLAAWHVDDLEEVACLLTSELVTNAVRYAGELCEVTVKVQPSEVRVEVLDSSMAPPVLHAAGPDDESGRGLMLVDALSSSWGVTRRAGTKSVWFSLARAC